MIKRLSVLPLVLILVSAISCSSQAPSRATLQAQSHLDSAMAKWHQNSTCCTAEGKRFAAVSGGPNASKIAVETLNKGGNVIDAAVAAAFALCVERPQSTGIGGGGFMTLYWKGKPYFIDFREVAPLKAHKDMYLDEHGQVRPGSSQRGGLAVGVPGMVAGLKSVHQKWGKLPWGEVMKPAVDLAEKGMVMLPTLSERIALMKPEIVKDAYLSSVFLTKTGEAPAAGVTFVQKDLAATLRAIAKQGPDAFYRGALAKKIVQTVNEHGGVFQEKDLTAYKVKMREPIVGKFGEFTIVTAPPPSAGGVMMAQMLGILSSENIGQVADRPLDYVHLLAEVMRRGYADRSEHAGDPDFVKVPVKQLLDADYLAKQYLSINRGQATPSSQVKPLKAFPNNRGTTGLSIVDTDGNAVSATITVNTAFGAVLAVPGTGVLLNNEMDDFSVKPGEANAYGLTGSSNNAVEKGKRPVSSMTPTILLKNGKPVAALTGAGGSRIISGIFQALLHYTSVKPGDMRAAIFAPRMHHQWVPDQVDLEEGWSADLGNQLGTLGHKVTAPAWQPNILGVGYTASGTLQAVYDPRDIGGAAAE